MVSPLCEVKDGAGSYQATTGGVDVTSGNTITIHLIDSSASTWSVSCTSTDETNVASTVTSGLTINSVARTATFTAPSKGSALIFTSVVNNGVGVDGVAVSSYTTTFAIYVKTDNGDRVLAAAETTEGSSSYGWITTVNKRLRRLALSSDSKMQRFALVGTVATADATVTTVASYTMADETICYFRALITAARGTNVTKGAVYIREVAYRRTGGGIATIVGALSSVLTSETDATMDATIDTDGASTVRVRVTGLAATAFTWSCNLEVIEQKP